MTENDSTKTICLFNDVISACLVRDWVVGCIQATRMDFFGVGTAHLTVERAWHNIIPRCFHLNLYLPPSIKFNPIMLATTVLLWTLLIRLTPYMVIMWIWWTLFVDNDRDRDAARFILGLIGLFMLGWWISGMLFFSLGKDRTKQEATLLYLPMNCGDCWHWISIWN